MEGFSEENGVQRKGKRFSELEKLREVLILRREENKNGTKRRMKGIL